MIECHPILPGETGRQEWLTWRKADVTASEIGCLLGVHPYVTPLKLFWEKQGLEFPPRPETKMMRRGRRLENVIGLEVEDARPGWKCEPVNAYYRDAEERLGATPDLWIYGDPRGKGVVQCKTTDPRVLASQWDDGRVPPEWIQYQCRLEMMLTDSNFGAIAALDPFGWHCHIFELERDAAAEQAIVAAARKFWQQVRDGVEPDPDFENDIEVVRALTAKAEPGKVADLTGNNRLGELLDARASMLQAINDYEGRCKGIETEIKYLLGPAEQAVGVRGWKISFKVEHTKAYSVPARSPRVLRIRQQKGDSTNA